MLFYYHELDPINDELPPPFNKKDLNYFRVQDNSKEEDTEEEKTVDVEDEFIKSITHLK